MMSQETGIPRARFSGAPARVTVGDRDVRPAAGMADRRGERRLLQPDFDFQRIA